MAAAYNYITCKCKDKKARTVRNDTGDNGKMIYYEANTTINTITHEFIA